MTDEEWQRASAPVSRLTADARAAVEYAIEEYERGKVRHSPALTRDELSRAACKAEELAELLEVFGAEEREALDFAWNEPHLRSTVDRKLAHVNAVLQDLAKHAAKASLVAAADKQTYYASPVQVLVGFLDHILKQFAETRAKRSNKGELQFVEIVCAIADPKIGKGSIDEAIKGITKLNGEVAKFLKRKNTTTIRSNVPGTGATRRVSWKCIQGGDRS